METKHTQGHLKMYEQDGVAILSDDAIIALARYGKDQRAADTRELSKDEAIANARRLVHSWNCHDALVIALQRAIEIIENHTPRQALGLDWVGTTEVGESRPILDEYLHYMRKAISEATRNRGENQPG